MKLLRTIYAFYREFWQHPEFRGPNFNWLVPLGMAYRLWRTY